MAKKKFSQPALPGMPRPRDIMTPEARYPRGYTPDRQRAISEGLKNVPVDELTNDSMFSYTGWDDLARANEGRKKELRARTVSAIANSTIKPESLNGLTGIYYHPENIVDKDKNVAGSYNNVNKYISIRDDMSGDERNHGEFTLRHEIGHHVTRPMLENLPDEKFDSFASDSKDTQTRVNGLKEGLADNYAMKHQGKIHKKGGPARTPSNNFYTGKGVKGNLGFGDDSEQEWGIGYTKAYPSERTKIFQNEIAKKNPEVADALGHPKQISLFSNNTLWGEQNEDAFRRVWGGRKS